MEQTAEDLKKLGNEAFAKRDFDTAIKFYSDAIKRDLKNHVFFSNRSASYAGKEEWKSAIEDAKECIKLDPSFLKGYYRLATAQVAMKDWDGATATIKQGLNLDNNNPQLMKQLQIVKAGKKAAAAAAKREKFADAMSVPSRSGAVDGSVSAELRDLQKQFMETNRDMQIVNSNMVHAQREYKSYELTKSEVSKLEATDDAKMYRSVGKMFVLSSRNEVMEHLNGSMESEKKRETELNQKMEYLEKRLKSTQQNIQELAKTPA